MSRSIISAILVTTLLLFGTCCAYACSTVSCGNGGVELKRDFVVRVSHEREALSGVSVFITKYAEGTETQVFSAVTASDGVVHVKGLVAGEYWIQVKLLGIYAAYGCFHVAERSSWRAKGKLKYQWGDFAPAVPQVAGRLVDYRLGEGATLVQQFAHGKKTPIRGTVLVLRNPVKGDVYRTTSSENGYFSFGSVPEGTYALHAEGGTSGRDYEGTDHLIEVSAKARNASLILEKRDPGLGGCGGTSLKLEAASN